MANTYSVILPDATSATTATPNVKKGYSWVEVNSDRDEKTGSTVSLFVDPTSDPLLPVFLKVTCNTTPSSKVWRVTVAIDTWGTVTDTNSDLVESTQLRGGVFFNVPKYALSADDVLEVVSAAFGTLMEGTGPYTSGPVDGLKLGLSRAVDV